MKKIIAVAVLLSMMLSFAACDASIRVGDNEISAKEAVGLLVDVGEDVVENDMDLSDGEVETEIQIMIVKYALRFLDTLFNSSTEAETSG